MGADVELCFFSFCRRNTDAKSNGDKSARKAAGFVAGYSAAQPVGGIWPKP
jgi:hypothetical protein